MRSAADEIRDELTGAQLNGAGQMPAPPDDRASACASAPGCVERDGLFFQLGDGQEYAVAHDDVVVGPFFPVGPRRAQLEVIEGNPGPSRGAAGPPQRAVSYGLGVALILYVFPPVVGGERLRRR